MPASEEESGQGADARSHGTHRMTLEEETQIRAVIAKEDELQQDWSKRSQNARHRRILLAEVERLRTASKCDTKSGESIPSTAV